MELGGMLMSPRDQENHESFTEAEAAFWEFLRRREAGEDLDFEEFCAERPRLAAVLRNLKSDYQASGGGSPRSKKDNNVPARSSRQGKRRGKRIAESWIGKRIGDYEVVSLLGRGGMGEVYRARHCQLKHEVALKLMRSGPLGDDMMRRFLREAKIAAKLKHPNLISLREFGSVGVGGFYYTMDLVHGEDYSAILARALPRPRAGAKFLAKVADAVAYAHRQAIIHRDLKPKNIMVTKDGEPVILDFGLAKRIEQDATVEVSRSGMVLGTLCYMAPEQVRGEISRLDARTDVYALGAILYETLTGRPPHVGESQLDLMQRIEEREPIPPRLLNPAVPSDLETICLKAMEKAPHRRYLSANALHRDLRAFLENRPIRAKPPTRISRALKFVQRHRSTALFGGIAALSLLLGLAFTLYYWQRAENALDDLARVLGEADTGRGTIAELQGSIRGLRDRAAATQESLQEVQRTLEERNLLVADLRDQIRQAHQERTAAQDEAAAAKQEVAALKLAVKADALNEPDDAVSLTASEVDEGALASGDEEPSTQVQRNLPFDFSAQEKAILAARKNQSPRISLSDLDVISRDTFHRLVPLWESGMGPFLGLTWAPSGELFTVRSADGVSFYELPKGSSRPKPVSLIAERLLRCTGLAYGKDDNTLATIDGSPTVKIWNLASGEVTRVFTITGGSAKSVALGPNGTYLAALDFDYRLWIWDLSGSSSPTSHRCKKPTGNVIIGPKGKFAVTWSNFRINVWNLRDRVHVREFSTEVAGTHYGIRDVELHPNGSELTVSCRYIMTWDLTTGKKTRHIDVESLGGSAAHYHPRSGSLSILSKQGLHALSSTGRPAARPFLKVVSDRSGTRVAWQPSAGSCVAFFNERLVKIIDIGRKRVAWESKRQPRWIPLAVSPGGDTIVLGSSSDAMRVFRAGTNRELQRLSCRLKANFTRVAVSPNGDFMGSIGGSSFRLWRLSRSRVEPIKGEVSKMRSLAFSPDGRWLALGSAINTNPAVVRIFSIEEKKLGNKHPPIHIPGDQRSRPSIWQLYFSPDSRYCVALVFGHARIPVIDVDHGTIAYELDVPDESSSGSTMILTAGDAAFDSTGRTLALSEIKYEAIWLWDFSTRQVKQRISPESQQQFGQIAFSQDDSLLVATARNGSRHDFVFFDVETGRPIGTVPVQSGASYELYELAFAAGGKLLCVRSRVGKVGMWGAPKIAPR